MRSSPTPRDCQGKSKETTSLSPDLNLAAQSLPVLLRPCGVGSPEAERRGRKKLGMCLKGGSLRSGAERLLGEWDEFSLPLAMGGPRAGLSLLGHLKPWRG